MHPRSTGKKKQKTSNISHRKDLNSTSEGIDDAVSRPTLNIEQNQNEAPQTTPEERTSGRGVGRPKVYVPTDLILRLKQKGFSLRQIATVTGFGYGSVRRALASQQEPNEK